jgi:hypothetical protein
MSYVNKNGNVQHRLDAPPELVVSALGESQYR